MTIYRYTGHCCTPLLPKLVESVSGTIVCPMTEVDITITDTTLIPDAAKMQAYLAKDGLTYVSTDPTDKPGIRMVGEDGFTYKIWINSQGQLTLTAL